MSKVILESLQESAAALEALMNNSKQIANIEAAAQKMIDCLENGGQIFSCGNGGSMSDAMHFAEELSGRYRKNRRGLAASAISDPGHISCVANDFGYDYIFSRYLEAHARPGDLLLGISTSGNSANVIEAAKIAKELQVQVIILTGKPESKLSELADIYLCTAGGEFADRVQELHIKVIHIIIELIERHFFPENYN